MLLSSSIKYYLKLNIFYFVFVCDDDNDERDYQILDLSK
jgi:hypothetical protein